MLHDSSSNSLIDAASVSLLKLEFLDLKLMLFHDQIRVLIIQLSKGREWFFGNPVGL